MSKSNYGSSMSSEKVNEHLASLRSKAQVESASVEPAPKEGEKKVFDQIWEDFITEAEVEPSPEEEGFARWGWNIASGDYANGYIDGRESGYHTCGSCEHAWEGHDGECAAHVKEGSICGCPRRITTEPKEVESGDGTASELCIDEGCPQYPTKHVCFSVPDLEKKLKEETYYKNKWQARHDNVAYQLKAFLLRERELRGLLESAVEMFEDPNQDPRSAESVLMREIKAAAVTGE